jgi:hypothetical protein
LGSLFFFGGGIFRHCAEHGVFGAVTVGALIGARRLSKYMSLGGHGVFGFMSSSANKGV